MARAICSSGWDGSPFVGMGLPTSRVLFWNPTKKRPLAASSKTCDIGVAYTPGVPDRRPAS